jgi:D-alanyl-D-alanine carboxypeptidase/D-alanyl-D-alanine-endopeptidase (penicillin-binding protein 4)
VNKNCVTVTVSPDTIAPGAIMLSQQPATSYVDIVSCARVTADSPGVPLSVNRLFRERSNTIVVRGDLRPDAPPASFRTTVWQPELYAARLFREACERRGMAVYGTERFGSTPSTFRAIGEIRRRFDSVIVNLNKQSDNLSAECTLKALGAAASGPPGTFSAGVSAVDRMLDAFGIDTTRYRLVDGSGVSHYNLISADLLIRVLAGMAHQRELFPIYYSSLPLAGRDGTLAHRMQHTPAEGNVHAKTGSLSGVSSLSGYARTQEGELLAFSIIMENFVAPTDRYRAVQDSIAVLLASFTRHPQFSRR